LERFKKTSVALRVLTVKTARGGVGEGGGGRRRRRRRG